MSTLPTLPGFDSPVDDAQAVFRAVLGAFSRPGLPVPLSVLPPPLQVGGFSQGMLALALALCDKDTPLWLDAAADTPEARRHLRFHCASPLTEQPSEASFAFIAKPESMPRLGAFKQGRADFPDRSTTLVINANLSASQAQTVELTGPGVKGNDRGLWQRASIDGLPAWFWKDWEANYADYPLGVDVIFVDTGTDASSTPQTRLLGLPRTACVRETAKERPACM
ncbi:MAG: phosphonate C-P lyase system protein PhnH [Betaproteobacteria bacterium]|nr:phosphonate C-P lyase system protein PhnH [Betaproteobacteria bacterium]